ncbi:MAG: polysaccharide biosynthesis tyrosine autokinase [Bacteroidales bacterium]|nr:polysaccharide biosynthesis tyrosine autokinase [Bacteroidales bacterium]
MSENINNPQTAVIETESFNIRNFLFKCLSKWYWFLISLLICFGAATFYLVRTPKIYTRSATVLIKESAVRRSSNELESMLTGGINQNNSKLANEIIALQSPDLMRSVVERMGLDFDYFAIGRARKHVLYGVDLPIKARFLEPAGVVDFEVTPVSSQSFKIRMENPKTHEEQDYAGSFGDTLSTMAGQLVITRVPESSSAFSEPIFVHHTTFARATNSYNSRLSAAAVNSKNYADVLDLTITDQSPRRAEDVLDMVITVYNENWVDDRNKMAVSTSLFIDDRLKNIEKELGNVDTDISSYKSKYVIPDVAAVSSMYMSQSQEANRKIQDLDNQLYTARYIRTSLSTSSSMGDMLPSPAGLTNTTIANQISKYNDLVLKRNNLVANSSERNPLVQEMDSSLGSMRGTILTSIDDLINTLEAQKASIQKAEQKATSRLADNPNQAKYLLSVERQQKVKEALYVFLLQKREENELSQAFTAYNTRVITKPHGSSAPTFPSKKKILLIAFLLGLMIPFGIIYLIIVTDTKVRSRKDTEGLSAPFLGEVPLSGTTRKKKKDNKDSAILVKHNKRDAVNEAFRVCRTNLEFMTRGSDSRVVTVTSFNPGSGKTFISSNLGAAMSIKGSKVLLIDGDLRHASLSSLVGSPKKGLANYLSGEALDVHSLLVQPEGYDNLSVLPVGVIPPNPSELVGSNLFAELVNQVKKEFDYVFIDCPPFNIVADTQIIADMADRTIFVLRAGVLEKSMLSELEGIYQRGTLKNMTVLLNATEMASGRGYGYRYGYGYGYGYGYHSYGYYSDKEK